MSVTDKSRTSYRQNLPSLLWLVALPIGCDEDCSPRVKSILEEVDLVLAEDTRYFRLFAVRHGLKVRAIERLDAHREASCEVADGSVVALVTDAGTPGISDPGARYVRRCVGVSTIKPVPGPSALSTFLSVSAFESGPISFEGFFPREKKCREQLRDRLLETRGAFVWFESPRRLRSSLACLLDWCPNRSMTLAKELTKTFESIRYGTVGDLFESLESEPKGEWVMGLHASLEEKSDICDLDMSLVQELVQKGLGLKEASQFVAKARSRPRNALYQAVLRSLAKG